MKYNPDIHHRKSIRLKDYDYSSEGLYFITICTQNKEYLFGEIVNGEMILNGAGLMVEKIYKELSIYFKNINFEEYVIMPNHFHCIIKIVDMVGVPLVGTQMSGNNRATTRVAPTIGDIIGAFKSLTTVEYIKMVKNNQLPSFDKQVWQRNYYENIIRNEKAYLKVMEYIKDNPLKWDEDRYR